MLTFKKIKNFYDKGFWDEDMVRDAVKLGKITKEEFFMITNKEY